jgi:hypothetical protein
MAKQPLSLAALGLLLNTQLKFATKQPGHIELDPSQLRHDPALEGALTASGTLIVHPHAFWRKFNQTEITHFCVNRGIYCIPTTELVSWLAERIAGRSAIEIGSGSGVLATALGIQATDNRLQERPDIAHAYRAQQQTPIRYGAHVEKLDAAAAVKNYKPEVVVAAWVTHKYREHESWREGNMHGIEEEKLIPQVKCYIHIGHTRVHEGKPALDLPHTKYDAPWLVSRAMPLAHHRNQICWWDN